MQDYIQDANKKTFFEDELCNTFNVVQLLDES